MHKSPRKPIGELALIEHIGRASSSISNKFVTLGIGDDCAILRPPRGYEILVTTDFTLEDRHFRRALHPPESVGHRCLARGLSDLAAMGATPLAAFLSLALPAKMLAEKSGQLWIDGFLRGLRELSEYHNVPLAGGDTSESPLPIHPGRHHPARLRPARPGPSPLHSPPRRRHLRDRPAGRSSRRTRHYPLPQTKSRSPHHNRRSSSSLPRTPPRHRRSPSPSQSGLCLHRHQRRPLHRPRPPLPSLSRPRRTRSNRNPHPPHRPQTQTCRSPQSSTPWRRRLRTPLHRRTQNPHSQTHWPESPSPASAPSNPNAPANPSSPSSPPTEPAPHSNPPDGSTSPLTNAHASLLASNRPDTCANPHESSAQLSPVPKLESPFTPAQSSPPHTTPPATQPTPPTPTPAPTIPPGPTSKKP